MNLFKNLINKDKTKETEIILIITSKLKPWIILNCLKKDNYIINDSQAEIIAKIIIKQAIELNVFDKILKKIRG